MPDFQSSIPSLLNLIYSDISQVECLFNLSKNVFRRVPHIELQRTYLTDPLCRGNICMISAPSFVLVQNVTLTFNELWNHCGIDEQLVFLFILKLITSASWEWTDVCSHYSPTRCEICMIGSSVNIRGK